jgi:oxygen-independent coproporphyrinogen-3 oxidase
MSHAGLYIHIPFCQSKCGYCSFNSIPADRETADHYLGSVAKQAIAYSVHPQIGGIVFDSIFFGGGTPTLASANILTTFLESLFDLFHFTSEPEISIEANPNNVTAEDLQILRQSGFNRISFGVQSFQDDLLTKMERTHTGTEAIQAVHMARKARFNAVNCDLIYGLPGQTAIHWQDDLATILDLGPEHISLYELSVEPGTAFHNRQSAGTLILPDDDTLADMEELSKAKLAKLYHQYEISNFARSGHQCRHNLTYWQNGTYLGLGAGAVSCIDGLRFNHQPSAKSFMQAIHNNQSTIIYAEALSPKARFRETIIMGLRLTRGVNLNALQQQTGLSPEHVYGTLLDELLKSGKLVLSGDALTIHPQFRPVANQILHQLV